MVPECDPGDVCKPACFAVEGAKQSVLRWKEATELPNDENAVADHFD
jgi:hypothetical protein